VGESDAGSRFLGASAVAGPSGTVLVDTVFRNGEKQAVWVFDAEVSYDDIVDEAFKINGASPIGMALNEPTEMVADYAEDFELGDPWSIDETPLHVVPLSGSFVVPQSGVVEE